MIRNKKNAGVSDNFNLGVQCAPFGKAGPKRTGGTGERQKGQGEEDIGTKKDRRKRRAGLKRTRERGEYRARKDREKRRVGPKRTGQRGERTKKDRGKRRARSKMTGEAESGPKG